MTSSEGPKDNRIFGLFPPNSTCYLMQAIYPADSLESATSNATHHILSFKFCFNTIMILPARDIDVPPCSITDRVEGPLGITFSQSQYHE